MSMDLSKAKDTFLQEARELLQQFETLLLKAESEKLDKEDLNALFRCAHTIKGSSGLFGFDAIVAFTHTVENILDQLRNQTIELTPELSNLLLKCRDGIERLVNDAENSASPATTLSAKELSLQAQLAAVLAPDKNAEKLGSSSIQTVTPPETPQRWHIRVKFNTEVMRNGVDPVACLRYLATLGEISEITTRFHGLPEIGQIDPEACYTGFDFVLTSSASQQEIDSTFDFAREGSDIQINRLEGAIGSVKVKVADVIAKAPDIPEVVVSAPAAKYAPERRAMDNRFIKVEAAKLDRLINLVGELVIAGASANVLAGKRNDPAMQESISVMSTLVEMIRDGALNMRMVPVGEIFQRFPRVVRDVSQELGKDIELKISGEETELDKSMVEKLTDPLMHIVRNALDHGIEPSNVRLQNGKPAKGKISLTAFHESGSVVIEVSDDGGGIRRDKVLKKAIERGLVSPDQHLSDDEIYQLLFEPGFSTADTVTNLSGRGVGMDVVRKNVEALRGEIEVQSREGKGSTIQLRLPLTLAIIDGFLVKVGESHFVIPLDMVVECIELPPEESAYRHYIELRGEVLPYVDVRDLFGIEAQMPKWRYIVVVQYGNKRAGFVVDSLLGELQVVIKPLGKLFRRMRGLSGSAILGSGDVALILDIPQLVQFAARLERDSVTGKERGSVHHESKVSAIHNGEVSVK